MSEKFDIVDFTLAASLATAGTITIGYPSGRQKGDYLIGGLHKLVTDDQNLYSAPNDFTLTFNANASSITLTWKASRTLAQGTALKIQMARKGDGGQELPEVAREKAVAAELVYIDLGSPITLDVDGLIAAATGTELPVTGTLTKTYTLPDDGGTSPTDGANTTGVLDVARNVTAVATNAGTVVAMTIVVTGTDIYGETMVESLSIAGSGTGSSAAGAKAFKEVTEIEITAAAAATGNTLNMGWGDVFGLPIFLTGTGHVLRELEDGSTASAGTIVKGDPLKATATTGDVRGTYHQASAANGDKAFALIVAAVNPSHVGAPQYAG